MRDREREIAQMGPVYGMFMNESFYCQAMKKIGFLSYDISILKCDLQDDICHKCTLLIDLTYNEKFSTY